MAPAASNRVGRSASSRDPAFCRGVPKTVTVLCRESAPASSAPLSGPPLARDVHRAHPDVRRPRPARAAAVDIQQYQPTPFSDGYLRVDGTAILPRWRLHVGLDLDYAWKSLVLVDVAPAIQRSRKTTYDFIGHAVGGQLDASMGLGGRFEIGALVPVTAFQTGDDVPGGEAARSLRSRQRQDWRQGADPGRRHVRGRARRVVAGVAALGLGRRVHPRHPHPPSRGACSASSRRSDGARA